MEKGSHLPKAFITAPSPASYAATGRMEIFILQRETSAAFPPHRSKVFGGIGVRGKGNLSEERFPFPRILPYHKPYEAMCASVS